MGAVFIIIAAIAVTLLIGFSVGVVFFITKPRRPSLDEAYEIERKKGYFDYFSQYDKEELNIEASDGYLLHGTFLKNPGKKFVVITHGYSFNRWGSMKYANMYYKMGYNVYLYDLRHYGDNQKCYCSMGYWESRDIASIVSYFRMQYGTDIEIGLHGESLGAASSLLALGLCEKIAFCVADCPFSDLGILLEDLCKVILHLPKKLSHLGSYGNLLLHHYRFDRVRPIDVVRRTRTPLLFMHGAKDDFISPFHSRRMFEAAKGFKQLKLFKEASHAESFQSAPEEYENVLQMFLNKVRSVGDLENLQNVSL